MSQFVSHSPWYVYLLCLLAALGFTAFLYFKNPSNKELPKVFKYGIPTFRFLTVFFILLLLCDFYFKSIQRRNEKPLLLFAIDNSTSMLAAKDSNAVRNFIQEQFPKFKTDLDKRFEIVPLLFGSEFNVNTSINFKEKETDFELLFQEIERLYSNRNVAALILLSDGIRNKGAYPLHLAENIGVPIYCISTGDTTVFRDLRVQKISHNQIAYLGNNFQVEVFVQAEQLKGKLATLKLMQDGQEKARTTFTIPNNQFSSSISFTLNAENIGVQSYKAQLEVLQDESNTLNNTHDFLIEVQDRRQKILFLSQAPHPDVSAIRESLLNNPSFELETGFVNSFKGSLKPYSLLILHGAGTAEKKWIENCSELSLPFWIIQPNSTDVFPGLRMNGNSNRYNDVEALVNDGFSLFTLKNELNSFLQSAPAVKCTFGRYILSTNATCLLFQKIGAVETSEPLFVFNETSGLKSACFVGDGLWKWKMRDFAEHKNHNLFNELIFSTVHYLSVKNDKSQFRLRYNKMVNENQNIEFEADVYNKSYEIIHNAEVTLELVNSKKEKFKYSFSSNGSYYTLNLGELPPDSYNFIASSKFGEEIQNRAGKLVVKKVNSENLNLVAKPELLQQIAQRSGGKILGLQNLNALQNEMQESTEFKTITYSINQLNRMIDKWILFFLILFMLVMEWMIRKRYLRI